MKGVGQIISIVEKTLGLKLDEESMDYGRFIIHLKFFMRGILFDRKTRTDNIPDSIYKSLQNQNEAASQCVEKIAEYVSETYDYVPTEDEKLYLLVHVLRTVEQKKTSQKGDCYGKD